jgi:hypothetical protein
MHRSRVTAIRTPRQPCVPRIHCCNMMLRGNMLRGNTSPSPRTLVLMVVAYECRFQEGKKMKAERWNGFVRSALDGALPTTTPSAFQLVVAWRRSIVPELPAFEPPGDRVQLGGRDDGHCHSQACSGAASSDCDSRRSVYHLSPHSPLSESICPLNGNTQVSLQQNLHVQPPTDNVPGAKTKQF